VSQCQDFSPPPWPKLLELGAQPGYRLTRDYIWMPAVPRRSTPRNRASTALPCSTTATNRAATASFRRRPNRAAEPPPHAASAQGEHGDEVPSVSSPFCPISRPPPWLGSPAGTPTGQPPRGLPPFPCLCLFARRKKVVWPKTPSPFPFPKKPLPLFPLSPFSFHLVSHSLGKPHQNLCPFRLF
jgi:hypothetical protein